MTLDQNTLLLAVGGFLLGQWLASQGRYLLFAPPAKRVPAQPAPGPSVAVAAGTAAPAPVVQPTDGVDGGLSVVCDAAGFKQLVDAVKGAK